MVKGPVQGMTPDGAFVFLERACTYDFRREDSTTVSCLRVS